MTLARGKEAEQHACRYLKQQGLRIVAQNYRCRLGEIDIVARDQRYLVFVEVRYRQSSRFGSAAESVTPRKQQRLMAAARSYLGRKVRHEVPCRFDVIEALNEPGGEWQFNWLKNAFQE